VTATPELAELVTGVVEDCSPDEVLVDVEEEVEEVEAVAVELILEPGIV
jgi:hypothetical protein